MAREPPIPLNGCQSREFVLAPLQHSVIFISNSDQLSSLTSLLATPYKRNHRLTDANYENVDTLVMHEHSELEKAKLTSISQTFA